MYLTILNIWLNDSILNIKFLYTCIVYGIEAMRLNKSQINSLTFPYNSGFMKLFETYDVKTITQCQFYSGSLAFNYLFDLKRMNFYSMLNASRENPAVFCFTGLVRMK